MFFNTVPKYAAMDWNIELIIMLLAAFLLGYLLRYFISRSGQGKQNSRISELESSLDGALSERNHLAAQLEGFKAQFQARLPKSDDLKVVEGVGPKIESLLKESGIQNWNDLANAELNKLKDILNKAGDRYRIHNPATWPQQAHLAAQGKWDELEKLQQSLTAGRA